MKTQFDFPKYRRDLSRRTFLRQSAYGLGATALGALLKPSIVSAANPNGGVLDQLHLPGKAKRVIQLTMAGGPSHLETFDYKPKLAEIDGKPMPESFTKGQQLAQLQGATLKAFGPTCEFQQFS